MDLIHSIIFGITILTIIRKIKDPFFKGSEQRIKNNQVMLELYQSAIIRSELIFQTIFFLMYGYIAYCAYIRCDMFLFATGLLQMLCVVIDAIDAVFAYVQGDSFESFFWISKKWYWVPNLVLDVLFLIGLVHYFLL